MNLHKDISEQIETHNIDGIKACFEQGLDPNDFYENKSLFDLMVSMYTRTPRFKDCVRTFVEAGLKYDNKAVLAVLLDDESMLKQHLTQQPKIITQQFTLPCAFTPLYQVSLLHICAEFNHTKCAKLLIENGANIDAKAELDDHGFGGQTPIFHTVNQNNNNSADMLELLLRHNADLNYTVKGIIWGSDFPWETLIPAANPISYAMFGLLPQMHRNEKTVAKIVSQLLKKAHGINYHPQNVPNTYLKG